VRGPDKIIKYSGIGISSELRHRVHLEFTNSPKVLVKRKKPMVRDIELLKHWGVRIRQRRALVSELDDDFTLACSSYHSVAEAARETDGVDGAAKILLGEPVALCLRCQLV